MQTMPTDLVNNGNKPFINGQLTVLNNMVTRKVETIWTSKIITSTKIQTDQTNRIIDRLREDNAQLQDQDVDLAREVRSTVASNATP